MNGIKRMLYAALLAASCSSPTTPSENPNEWEDYEWVPCADLYTDPCSVLCSVSGDSLYIMVTQEADTTDWFRCNMPDLVEFRVISEGIVRRGLLRGRKPGHDLFRLTDNG